MLIYMACIDFMQFHARLPHYLVWGHATQTWLNILSQISELKIQLCHNTFVHDNWYKHITKSFWRHQILLMQYKWFLSINLCLVRINILSNAAPFKWLLRGADMLGDNFICLGESHREFHLLGKFLPNFVQEILENIIEKCSLHRNYNIPPSYFHSNTFEGKRI